MKTSSSYCHTIHMCRLVHFSYNAVVVVYTPVHCAKNIFNYSNQDRLPKYSSAISVLNKTQKYAHRGSKLRTSI